MTTQNSPDSPEKATGLTTLFQQDPTPLCFMGLCLELLRMQRHVDERLAAMKAQIPPDDPSTHNLLFLVFRAYGLESTFLKSVPVLIGDWNLHKASGKKDIEYLNGLNAKLNAWRAAIAAVAPRN